MGVVGRLDQYGSMLAGEFDEVSSGNVRINNLGTYIASEFLENISNISQADHGYVEWYCLVSGTATYSIINSTGGSIFERNGSTVTTLVNANTPQRGTITVTAGRFYYGNVPINLVVEDQQHSIAPLTMMGMQFWNIAVRSNPSIYYVYSPYQPAIVNFYDNTSNGIAAGATSTLSLSAGQIGTFTSNNLTNHWITSNVPILASVTQTGSDKTILSPMSTYVYQRFQAYYNTTNNTIPTNLNAYVTYDNTYKVMNMSIADGSGGDCAQGLGLEYLADTYSWGNVLSDYTIVFPYTATVVTSYWNGSAWVVWDTHSNITGSITNPPRITRDGTNGPGIEASTINGAVTDMASGATLWKWEGTAPFYLCINDSTDDEFSMLGWMTTRLRTISTNVFSAYDPINAGMAEALYGSGLGTYMTQNNNKSVIVYNEIDEITDFRDIVRDGIQLDLDAASSLSYSPTNSSLWRSLHDNNITASLVNGATYESSNGGSLLFNGTSQHVSVPFAINSSYTELTTEIVIKSPVAGNSNTGYLIWDHAVGAGGWPMWLAKTGSNEWYWFWNYNASVAKSASISAASYTSNTWIYIAVRAYLSHTTRIAETNNFAELIINGSTYSTNHRNDNTLGFAYPDSPLYLARRGSSIGNGEVGGTVSNFSNVNIAMFRIYNKVLSRQQIRSNYESIRHRFNLP